MSRFLFFLFLFVLVLGSVPAATFSAEQEITPFEDALERAADALDRGLLDEARRQIERAAERDGSSRDVWSLRARWAEEARDRDELVFALHRLYRLAVAQKAPRREQRAIRMRLEEADPVAPDLFNMRELFLKRLLDLAKFYEKKGRPHSAIRIHKEILALDPERAESREAIERIASAPDPSLAGSAKRKDLFAGISDEWIREFDASHDTWETRGVIKGENYTTQTDAGYRVLLLASEAMEHINAFYRVFFRYGTPEDGHSVSRIDLKIFRNRDEYLKLGTHPAEWSGGQFTGSAVETYIGKGGFASMISVLFHEAAHQFVALATNAVGWLNEGLASFFEGTRILANGTVQFNLPANHRLFPLAERMEHGWMTGPGDGIDPEDPAGSKPEKAPTFRIVIENKYQWGPPWYAPTWGVVYFLYNYQDPVDGRFVYRRALQEFIDKSGGRTGEGAVDNFEEVVLGNPEKPTKGVVFPGKASAKPPKTVEELDLLWKEWILELRDEQMGRIKVEHPWRKWAGYAVARGDIGDARELFEKGIVERPEDVDLLLDFARLLAGKFGDTDRAAELALEATRVLETREPVDAKALRKVDNLLARWDPRFGALRRIHEEMSATVRSLARRYLDEGLTLMTMDLSWRLGSELHLADVFEYFEKGMRRSGKAPWTWELAYNEKNLDGWVAGGSDVFTPNGPVLDVHYGTPEADRFDYRFLVMDRVTSGDFSMEAEVSAEGGETTFCGLVFGRKSDQSFHALVLFPAGGSGALPVATGEGKPPGARTGGKPGSFSGKDELAHSGFVDLTSFYGAGSFHVWRHNPVDAMGGTWHTMRADVTGRVVDVWFDGELVTTQEFADLGVLRGSFGLITGLGSCRFRNIRFLSRSPGDLGARIARKIRMEKIRKSSAGKGGSLNGSWVGLVPPWLDKVEWVQGRRSSWDDKGAVPTFLVFWSRRQNRLIPLNGWLAAMARKYAAAGLEFVSVAEHDDRMGIEDYLKEHLFPGAVAVDRLFRKGYGETFETYGIGKFNLPRILLLDIDHRVVWEGDPGFKAKIPWKSGMESYVEPALDNLVKKRRLDVLFKWRTAWTGTGRKALHDGDLATALPLMREAAQLDAGMVAEVREALDRLEAIEETCGALEAAALTLKRDGREPALAVLLEWCGFVGKKPDSRTRRALSPYLSCRNARDWHKALDLVARRGKRLEPGGGEAAARSLVEELRRGLAPLEGPFPRELAASLETAAAQGGGAGAIRAVLDDAPRLPARWLAREYFRF